MSIDCANSAVIFFFFNTSHCLFPIFKKKIHIFFVPLGLALQHVLSVIRAVAAWGRCSRRMGVSGTCLQPLWSIPRVHPRCLQAVLKRGRGSPKDPLGLLQLQAGGGGVGWPVPLWKGSLETMTGRMIWLWCCSAPFPITRVEEGGRWVPFDHCLQIQLLHVQKRSLPPSSHVL